MQAIGYVLWRWPVVDVQVVPPARNTALFQAEEKCFQRRVVAVFDSARVNAAAEHTLDFDDHAIKRFAL